MTTGTPAPRLPVVTLPQACPPALGAFYRGMRVATAGYLHLVLVRSASLFRPSINEGLGPGGMCGPIVLIRKSVLGDGFVKPAR